MNRLYSLRLLSLACLTVPLFAQGEQDLRTTAKKGSSVWLVQKSAQEQAIDMGGQQMDMGNTTTFTVQVTVKDVDDKGNLVVEATVARVHGSMTLPMMGDVEFDSADAPKADGGDAGGGEEMGMPNLDGIGKAMTDLAGKTFVAKVDPFGRASSIEGVDKVLEAARTKAGRMGAQMLGGTLNEGTITRLFEGAFGILPEKPIAVGASWDRKEDGKASRMKVANKMQLTLAKIDAEAFEITATGTVDKPAGTEAPPAGADEGEEAAAAREMLSQMTIKNGKIAGSQRISRKDGFLIEATSVVSMDMEMPSPMGGDMSIAVKTTTSTKRTTAEEAMAKKAPEKKAEEKKEPAKEAGK